MPTLFIKTMHRYFSKLLPLLFLSLLLTLSGCDIFSSDGSDDTPQQNQEEQADPSDEEDDDEDDEDNEGDDEDDEDDEENNEPPPAETYWFKGNLHAHSLWTDGEDYPEMVLDWYKDQGYSFAVVSDHNDIHDGEQSVEVDEQDEQFYFDRYLESFGADWVEYEESDSVTTVQLKNYGEYSGQVSTGEFLTMRAQEIDYRDGDRLIHINGVNLQDIVTPSEGGTTPAIIQETVEAVDNQSTDYNQPMLATINHPNISESISAEDLKQVQGARFFEVYNGHFNATNEGHGSLHSTDELWDEVLTHYVQNGRDLLYGVASDDSHGYNFNNTTDPEALLPGRGWVAVEAEELTNETIIEAMYEGNFYASTGVELSDVTFEDGTLSISIEEEAGVNYTIQFIGTKENQTNNPGTVLAEENGTEASYTLADDDLYVRAKITSDQPKDNASSTGEFEVAWVQPVTP